MQVFQGSGECSYEAPEGGKRWANADRAVAIRATQGRSFPIDEEQPKKDPSGLRKHCENG